MDEDNGVAVDPHALVVDGVASLRHLRWNDVIHLAEPTLGMGAGHWRVSVTNDLRPISTDEAAAHAAEGHAIREARRSPDWEGPFALKLGGLRLDALRAALAALDDMPGDALVVLTSAEHPWEGRHSPAETGIETGRYMPNPGGGNYGDLYYDKYDSDEDVPEDAVPAVLLSPSN